MAMMNDSRMNEERKTRAVLCSNHARMTPDLRFGSEEYFLSRVRVGTATTYNSIVLQATR